MTTPRTRRVLDKVANNPGIYSFDCDDHGTQHYTYQYRVAGKQRWRTVHEPLKEVRKKRDADRVDAAKVVRASAGLITFGDLVERYLDRREAFVRPNTMLSYRCHWAMVSPQLGAVRLNDLEPDFVETTLLDMLSGKNRRRKYAATTVLHVRTLLRSATLDAVSKRLIPFDPLAGRAVQLPPLPRKSRQFWTTNTAVRAFQALEGDRVGQLLVGLGCFTGCRRSEMLGLLQSRVDRLGPIEEDFSQDDRHPDGLRFIAITRTVVRVQEGEAELELTKSHNSRRVVPIPTVLEDLLEGSDLDEHLLPFRSGNRRIEAIANAWSSRKVKLALLGIPPVTLHELRHSYATMLTDSDVNHWVAERILGHALPAMASLYIHQTWGQLQDAKTRVDAFIADQTAAGSRP